MKKKGSANTIQNTRVNKTDSVKAVPTSSEVQEAPGWEMLRQGKRNSTTNPGTGESAKEKEQSNVESNKVEVSEPKDEEVKGKGGA